MKIVLKKTIKFKGAWHKPEAELDVPKDLAKDLIEKNIAGYPQPDEDKESKPKGGDKKKTAEELIAEINAATSLEQLKALVPETETRKTVIDAASAKWTELEGAQQ